MNSPVMPVYRRANITMIRGEGCYLYDGTGKRYLDFATGIAVSALGHCHPHLVQALQKQASTLWHTSNMYWVPGVRELAQRLVNASFADSVFFCSSGAEAVECGIKMVRRYQYMSGRKERTRIITFEGGFHGRTMAGISAGGNEAAREGFYPLLEGFDRVPFNDMEAVEAAITEETAGILVEPIQGEGGVREADADFLRDLRALCTRHDLLLFFDEVQCGMGRTGFLLACEEMAIAPDIATIAKGIGGGFPLAACMANHKAAACMTPGSHGSTYGANPLAMAVGNAVLDVVLELGFLGEVQRYGKILKQKLQHIVDEFPALLQEARGRGLMLGLKTLVPNQQLAEKLRIAGLLTSPAVGDNVIRILPPLICTEEHIQEACDIIFRTCAEWSLL